MSETGSPRGTGPDELPAGEGLRSDQAGTAGGPRGVAPGGEAVDRAEERVEPVAQDGVASAQTPPSGQFTSASGGYGVGSGFDSSQGSGDGGEPGAGESETDWLRSEGSGTPKG